jgi:DNA-binding CsgD family transcriptional regulator
MLAGGSINLPERLQTMRHAIAWSYDLLPPAQRDLFRCMSVFVGGCGIDAVEHLVSTLAPNSTMVAVDVIAGLVDASLVQRSDSPGSVTRFTMLETIREFGMEQLLTEGDEHVARDAHASWCIEFADQAGARLAGPDHLFWWRRIETEVGNIRGAHAWLFRRNDAERAMRLGTAMAWFWSAPGYYREGRALFRRLIAMTEAERWPDLLDGALSAASNLEHWLDNLDAAESLNARRLALCRHRGDIPGAVATLRALGSIAVDRGDLDAASLLLAEGQALAAAGGSAWDAAAIANLQGIVAFGQGNFEEAAERSLAAIERWDAIDDIGHVASARVNQSRAVQATGETRRSAEILWRVLEVVEADVGDDMVTCDCLGVAAGVALASPDIVEGVQLLAASDAMLNRMGVSQRPCFREFSDGLVAQSRALLGEPAFAEAWATGASQSIVDSIDLAQTVTTAARLAQPALHVSNGHFDTLTEREKEVLRLVARGHSDKEIAAELGIARFTASNHVSNIRTKLDSPSRSAVAAVAARAGLT